MYEQLIAPLLIWLTATLNQTEKLASKETIMIFGRSVAKRLITTTLIGLATALMVWQIFLIYREDVKKREAVEKIKESEKKIEDLKQIIKVSNSKLFNEASGGTVVGDMAYVVDDENPSIFELRLQEGAYGLIDNIKLKENGRELTKDDVDDLEAIASSPLEAIASSPDGKLYLYLVTSHSNTRRGNVPARQRLLKVSLAPENRGEVVSSANNLRELMLKKLTDERIAEPYRNKEERTDELMQIEGFTIDEEGNAYFGLRAPLTRDDHALVLRAKLSELFVPEPKPEFAVVPLDIWFDSKHYGISSLDYDARNKRMLVVGTSPNNSDYSFCPVLCKWDFKGPKYPIQPVTDCRPINYPGKCNIPYAPRTELLLLPPGSEQVFILLDTDKKGDGGLLSFKRGDLGLE